MNMPMNGGYPYGYPPQNPWQQNQMQQVYASQYSPFINPTQQTQLENVYVTGDGQVHGATEGPISYQGINPTPQPYNPFAKNLNPQQQQQHAMHTQAQMNGGYNASANPWAGSNPYLNYQNGIYQPGYYGGYSYEYQCNQVVQDEIYGSTTGEVFDIFEPLRNAVMTDEEKERSKINTPIGYTYNGTPIYNNDQIATQQKEIENAKNQVTSFWMRLSKTAHHAIDDGITDEQIESAFFPEPIIPNNNYYQQVSKEQIEYSQMMNQVQYGSEIHNMFESIDQLNAARDQKIAEAYAQIKASHDRILGVDKEDLNLKTYLENAGHLYIEMLDSRQRRRDKDGTLRYESNKYKQLTGSGYDTVFMNNSDYIPLEARIRDSYARKKSNMLQLNADGTYTPSSPPPQVDPQKEQMREGFLKCAMEGLVL